MVDGAREAAGGDVATGIVDDAEELTRSFVVETMSVFIVSRIFWPEYLWPSSNSFLNFLYTSFKTVFTVGV